MWRPSFFWNLDRSLDVIDWTNVTDIAPELSTAPLAMQTAILAQVNAELDEDVWDTKVEIGRAYLAAHLGTILRRRGAGGPVVGESVGSVSRQYSASIAAGAAMLGSTSYGIEFERQLMTLAAARFTVA